MESRYSDEDAERALQTWKVPAPVALRTYTEATRR
jgi:hypothetical protein